MGVDKPWRVVLIDDHAVVRAGVRTIVDSASEFVVVAEAATVAEAAAVVSQALPDLVIVDLTLPDGSGADLLQALRRVSPDGSAPDRVSPTPKVLVLTMHDEPARVRQVIAAGADGYATKDAAGADLLDACRAVMRGTRYVQPSLGAALAAAEATSLTPREAQVLRLLALGHTNAEIAGQLQVGLRTVEAHRANLRLRLDVNSRAELLTEARRLGLV